MIMILHLRVNKSREKNAWEQQSHVLMCITQDLRISINLSALHIRSAVLTNRIDCSQMGTVVEEVAELLLRDLEH